MKFKLLPLLVFAFCLTVRAQVFIAGIGVTNTGTAAGTTTNAPVQNAFITQTNQVSTTLVPRTLQINNITTNETVIYGYGWQISSQGSTNLYVSNAATNNFLNSAGWTNGSSTNIPINLQSPIISVTPYGFLTVSNGSNTVLFY